MRFRWPSAVVFLLALFPAARGLAADPVRFDRLLCELAERPFAIDRPDPCFSWVASTTETAQTQSAFRIRVASSEALLAAGRADLWDSGRVASDETLHHCYAGAPLASDATYFWAVTIWDGAGREHASAATSFHTAILRPREWRARWIGAGPEKEPRHPQGFFKDAAEAVSIGAEAMPVDARSLLLRRAIELRKPVRSATAFVTGLGLYELAVNGARVGDAVLAPAKTNYRKQVLYDVHDVTPLLRAPGRNALGIHLGNGWFNPQKKWWHEYKMQWFGAKRALLQLRVVYADGEEEVFATDESWRMAPGPVLSSCIYDGEVYDATAERPGWSEPSFDDSAWERAHVVESPGGKLISQVMPPIRVVERRAPAAPPSEPKPGVRIFDMGQNFAGWVRVALSGKRGTRLRLRFAEDLDAAGNLDPTSNEGALATATYTLKGDGVETYEPRFTYFGFRYVEALAEGEPPEIRSLEGCVVHSANRATGDFRCGDELVNRIHRASVWSQKSNMMGYPTDCPQRDERLGWMGDAQVSADEALFNFDMAAFYASWLSTIRENQDPATGDIPIISPRPYVKDAGVEWSSTFILLAWNHYLHYGDPRVLSENYAAMKRYLRFLDGIAVDSIVPMGWIGDWGSMVKGWKEGEPESVPTAFYYLDAVTLAKIAAILGEPGDERAYSELAAKLRRVYNAKYYHPATHSYNDGSQMANAFPLFIDLVAEADRAAVLENVVADIARNDTHLTTGVLGTKYMIDALTRFGRPDVAWSLATRKTAPSWADMVAKYTTVCEFWTLKQSKNHVMMGSIDAWFYRALGGLRIARPAWKEFVVRPFFPDGLGEARTSIETVRGPIESSWTCSGDRVSLEVVVPFNTTALVHVPGHAVFSVPSGRHRFEASRR